MDLTTLDRVKSRMDFESPDTQDDRRLARAIKSASARIEKYCGRLFEQKARTRQYGIPRGATSMFVDAYPILDASTTPSATAPVINVDSAREFGSGTLVDVDNYYLKKRTGEIQFDRISLDWGPGAMKIVYTGGIAATPQGIVDAQPDLAEAVDLTVSYWFQRRQEVGLRTVSAEGGSISSFSPSALTDDVTEILEQFRKVAFGYGVGEDV